MEEGMGVGGRVSSMEERGGGGKCGRWNPTAEQVEVLTGLFRAGLRTPTTDQIQSISAELSLYGQIESKNVFYWFQNHKARERHKRRRVSASSTPHLHSTKLPHHGQLHRHQPHPHHTFPPHFSTPPPPPPSTCISQEDPLSNESSKRVIQTLQLFPLSSYNEPPTGHGNLTKECKESACDSFSYPFTFGKEIQHQPLDLCLTFL